MLQPNRLTELLNLEIEYINNKQFKNPPADFLVYDPYKDLNAFKKSLKYTRVPHADWLEAYFDELASSKVLTKQAEEKLFLKMNYAKYLFVKQRSDRRYKVNLDFVSRLENYLKIARETRDILIRHNLRLIVSQAKYWQIYNKTFEERISEGHVSIFRAVEKFDVATGYKFSTYLCNAVGKNYRRCTKNEKNLVFNQVEEFDVADTCIDPKEEIDGKDYLDPLMAALTDSMSVLTERELLVLQMRHGFGGKIYTLEEVGKVIDVTKERVRQIQTKAEKLLREKLQNVYNESESESKSN